MEAWKYINPDVYNCFKILIGLKKVGTELLEDLSAEF